MCFWLRERTSCFPGKVSFAILLSLLWKVTFKYSWDFFFNSPLVDVFCPLIPILPLVIMPVWYNGKYWSRCNEIVSGNIHPTCPDISFLFSSCDGVKQNVDSIKLWKLNESSSIGSVTVMKVSNQACVIRYSARSCGSAKSRQSQV